MKTLTLYHGSEQVVKKPELKLGKPYNDYGQGFYCTMDKELAKEWARKNNKVSYINSYSLDIDDLNVLNLENVNNKTLTWIALLLRNRKFDKNIIASQISKIIIDKYQIDLSKYDVVIGYRADDSYFSFANAFLNNTLPLEGLEKALHFGTLGLQVALISEKAFTKLKFIDYSAVPEEYYRMYMIRDESARIKYVSLVNEGFKNINNHYAIDIVREGQNK